MPAAIADNMRRLLKILADAQPTLMGESWVAGKQLQETSGLSPPEINDAITILRDRGLVEWHQYLGTAPFKFGQVTVTSRGRHELQQMKKQEPKTPIRTTEDVIGLQLPATPIGSPFGFTDQDWEIVAEAKSKLNELRVVLGCQFESEHYNTKQLKKNVRTMFQQAIAEYNQQPGTINVTLIFQPLTAGYGEHLFNEIARDIIAADIAVFETSDLNPNVMLEMGVALTWGIRVLPIKIEDCPKPPSDISGQTWADYRDSATEFIDPDHHKKLVRMVERAARKKGS